MDRTTFTIRRTLDAPREVVFRAWTEPGHLSHWFGPDRGFRTPAASIAVDARPGGRWRVVVVADRGTEVPVGGTYREVDAPGRLVFTTGDPDNADGLPASTVTVTLAARGDRTVMTFRLVGVNGDADHAARARAGWARVFARLQAHVASLGAGGTARRRPAAA